MAARAPKARPRAAERNETATRTERREAALNRPLPVLRKQYASSWG
jgi:hypothetical protein